MKAIVLTCFESNEPRVSLIKEAFDSLGYETKVVTTDFSHMNKKKRTNVDNAYEAIETLPYSKNMSINRIRSHIEFSRDSFKYIKKQLPDIIWVCAPANSLIKEAYLYKKANPSVKIVIDVIDMWPESLPISISKSAFPFSVWRNIRSKYIYCADYLVCECDLYKTILDYEYKKEAKTIYWAKNKDTKMIEYLPNEDCVHLLYLGSINNIIDIDGIKKMISNIDKRIILHIIGDGENREKMIDELKDICEIKYHGIVREEKEKSEIMAKCHAGINMYKKGLFIGLTVKCIDYFANGLPIINNIPNDTWDLVKNNNVGINVFEDGDIDSRKIFDLRNDYKRIHEFYENMFSRNIIIEKMKSVIQEVTK